MVEYFSYNKYLVLSFLSFAVFPILPVKFLGLPVILFFSASITSFIFDPNKTLDYRKLLIAVSPYLLFCISALYSEDIGFGLKKVYETRLSLLVVPLSFFLLSKDSIKSIKSQLYKFKLIYITSSFLLCIIYLCYLPFISVSDNPAFRFPSGFFFKSAAANLPLWYLEPVYFSFVIVIAFIFLCKLYHNKRIKARIFFIISFVYFCILFLMVSKIALVFTGIFTLWFVFYQIKSRNYRVIMVLVLLFSLYPIYKVPSIKYEIEEVQYFIKGKKRARDDANDKRKRITESALELAMKTNPIFGTGIGDVQRDLNMVYKKNSYDDLLIMKYDAHNQFLSMYLGLGLVGVTGLFIFLFYLVKTSINNQKVFILWVLCFFILQMLTETVLERQIPVILWSLIMSIILFLQGDNVKFDS